MPDLDLIKQAEQEPGGRFRRADGAPPRRECSASTPRISWRSRDGDGVAHIRKAGDVGEGAIEVLRLQVDALLDREFEFLVRPLKARGEKALAGRGERTHRRAEAGV